MSLGNFFVQIMLAYMIVDICTYLLKKNSRESIIKGNNRLTELRNKPVKTVEEQREFLDLCFPKRKAKYVFKWIHIWDIIKMIVIFMGLIFGMNYIFNWLHIQLTLMFAIFIILTVPLAVNWVLSKFGLNKHNPLMHMIGLGKR